MLMEMMALTGPGRLRTKIFLDTSVQKILCPGIAILSHFGPHSGTQNLQFCYSFWDLFFDHFLIIFWSTFGTILGPILGPARPKKGQDEPKTAIKRFTEPKLCNSKNLKKQLVFQCFWGPGLPKRASRGPRRLPRCIKELQSFNKKGSKNRPKNYQILDDFWFHFGIHSGTQKSSKREPKMGPLLEPLGPGSQGSE